MKLRKRNTFLLCLYYFITSQYIRLDWLQFCNNILVHKSITSEFLNILQQLDFISRNKLGIKRRQWKIIAQLHNLHNLLQFPIGRNVYLKNALYFIQSIYIVTWNSNSLSP